MAGSTVYGRTLQEVRRVLSASLTAFPINSTSTVYVLTLPSGMGRFRVESVEWVASASLSDSDGTMLVSVINYDASEAADDTLVSAASVEGGTAKVPALFTLATETSEKEFTLDEGDSLRVEFVNNSAAITTNGAISVFVTGYPIPDTNSHESVKNLSSYL